MTELFPMNDLAADDLLLDRLAARQGAGDEPVAVLLGALAAHADTPLPARTVHRKTGRSHRYIGAFAALAVAASGAGVAAAVTLPDRGLSSADRARIEHKMEQSARSNAPSAILTRLGLPQTSGLTEARGLVLYRQPDGTIVLLPASVVAAAEASGGFELASGEELRSIAPGSGKDTASGGNAYGATKGGQGGNSDGNAASGSQDGATSPDGSTGPGSGAGDEATQPTGTPPPGDGDEDGDTKGKKGVPPAPTPKPTPKSTPKSTPTSTPTPTDSATVQSYATIAPPTGRVAGSPTPESTAPVRSSGAPGDAGATGTPRATGGRSSGVATADPGTDSSTSGATSLVS